MSLYDVLNKKTVLELRSYCEDNGISLESNVKKAQIIAILEKYANESGLAKKVQEQAKSEEEIKNPENVINAISKKQEPVEVVETKKIKKNKNDIAVYSTRNLSWTGVGVLELGYNIVSKEASEKWITHKAVRIATPDEVARHYGTK
jgi:hypothetical protein